MPDATQLDEYYKTLTDQELLNLEREGGFTAEAEQVFRRELARRKLGPADLKHFVAATRRTQLQDEASEKGGGYRMPGLQFFGGRYLNEADRRADIQVRTKWFTISGIPLIPLSSYRFRRAGGSAKSVIDRVSLDWVQVFQTWIKTAIWFVIVILVIVGVSWYLDLGKH
jgi:hypothetical protein